MNKVNFPLFGLKNRFIPGLKYYVLGTVICTLIICPQLLNGQIGIKAGMGVSDLAFSENSWPYYLGYEADLLNKSKPLASFQAGIFVRARVGKQLYLQPEVLYVLQGANFSTKFLYNYYDKWIKIHYAQIPLILRYEFNTQKKWHLSIHGGLYGGIALAEKRTIFPPPNFDVFNSISNVNRFDFGISLGGAYNINLGEKQMNFEIRATYGLVNSMWPMNWGTHKYGDPTSHKVRNVNISASVGYIFKSNNRNVEND